MLSSLGKIKVFPSGGIPLGPNSGLAKTWTDYCFCLKEALKRV